MVLDKAIRDCLPGFLGLSSGPALLPTVAKKGVQTLAKLHGQRVWFFVAVERDSLLYVVNHDLARIAHGEMTLQFLADSGGYIAVDIFVEKGKQFAARGAFGAPD